MAARGRIHGNKQNTSYKGVNYKMDVLIANPLNETQRLLLYDFPHLIDET